MGEPVDELQVLLDERAITRALRAMFAAPEDE